MSIPGARTPREFAVSLLWVLALLSFPFFFPWWVFLIPLAGFLAWCFYVGVREHIKGNLPTGLETPSHLVSGFDRLDRPR
ncbi:MAG: hypothetical protein L0338_04985 [Acidobacteria bacterium]|nr:hypothetical protein [Acidobacteriota bacterium]